MVYDKENYSTFSTEKVPTAERIIYTAFEKDTYSIPIFNSNNFLENLLFSIIRLDVAL